MIPLGSSVSGAGIKITSMEYIPDKTFFVANFEKELVKGQKYIFSIQYIGLLNDNFRGFYRSKYKDAEGNIKLVIFVFVLFKINNI